jgi:hypothetical protein
MTVNAQHAMFPRRYVLFFFAFVATLGFAASPAFAERVQLSGKHSKDDVYKACDGVGGFKLEGAGGKGYGCYNESTGVLVACTDGGDCMGFIPEQKRMTSESKIPELLTLGRAQIDGSTVKDKGEPLDPFSRQPAAARDR